MRNYVKSHGLKISPEQLDLLVPAFDTAWARVRKRGGRVMLSDLEERAVKDQVAKVVVDIVMRGEISDPRRVAEAAVREILPP